MTNDTTTLDGALQELGELMATNLTTQGVTASASDGLTTLANKILDIQGGGGVPCYNVSFTDKSLPYGDWDFTSNGQVARLQIYLQYQYQPYQGTVTVSDGTNTYTVTTNANGIGTLSAPVTANSTTFTASYTNTSATFTVTKSNYLFVDACTSSAGLSKYDSSIPIYKSSSGNPSSVLSYDSTNNCYEIHATNTSTSYYSFIGINDSKVVGKTSYVASMEIYQVGSANTNEVGLYVDNSADTTSYGYGSTILGQTHYYYGKRFKESGVSTAHSTLLTAAQLSRGNWYIMELEYDGSKFYERLYDINRNLISSYSYSQTVSNTKLGLIQKGGTTAGTSNLIRNIKVRSTATS